MEKLITDLIKKAFTIYWIFIYLIALYVSGKSRTSHGEGTILSKSSSTPSLADNAEQTKVSVASTDQATSADNLAVKV